MGQFTRRFVVVLIQEILHVGLVQSHKEVLLIGELLFVGEIAPVMIVEEVIRTETDFLQHFHFLKSTATVMVTTLFFLLRGFQGISQKKQRILVFRQQGQPEIWIGNQKIPLGCLVQMVVVEHDGIVTLSIPYNLTGGLHPKRGVMLTVKRRF